jgi:hypothetical protein
MSGNLEEAIVAAVDACKRECEAQNSRTAMEFSTTAKHLYDILSTLPPENAGPVSN